MSSLRAQAIYGRITLANIVHRLVKRRARHSDLVATDYDQGEWMQQRQARRWEQVDDALLYADKAWLDEPAVVQIEGALWQMPGTDYYAYRRRMLHAILAKYDQETDTLYELGSGTGANLVSLATSNRYARLVGLELSATGRDVAREVVDHFGFNDIIRIGQIDLLDSDSPGFSELRGATCFTHYCLEQLPDYTERVFRNLISAGVSRVIMLEPSYELLSKFSLRDQASRTYVWRQDYQRTLVSTAARLRDEGLVRIIATEQLRFVSSPRNPPTLLVWEPVG
ncbi:class I SAM-dependent methyltransferase [Qipengyuania oceanensis]|uniref:Class I SAM-dependent methyltransferase n=1 Tax=Qipengyuania oceanensis TaxID=1463597 RepID=A0A844YGQ3_9SPHN|nr:hypothetical protein [Qipengyuania oceanensis]